MLHDGQKNKNVYLITKIMILNGTRQRHKVKIQELKSNFKVEER